jgi:hypothetical protein
VRLFRRPRVFVVLALQAVALGLLATGALGTSKDGPNIPAAPQIVNITSVVHSASVPLVDAPDVAIDPNRKVLEVERQVPSVVVSTSHDPVAQTAIGSASIPATTTSFQGLSRTDLSVGLWPPDTVGDVGPSQYVQATNGAIDVFSKTGDNLTGATSDASFWSGLTNCDLAVPNRALSDPTVNYDQFADRWVYSELAYTLTSSGSGYTGPYTMCVAVSETGDATGTWNRYAFGVGNSILPDYPKLGVWPDGYYISTNNFDSGGSFWGAGAMVLERSAMLAGATSPQALFLDLKAIAPAQFGMLPSDADGATPPPANAPNYFLASMDDTSATQNDQLGVWAFHVDWTSPGGSTFTNVQNLTVPQFDGNGISVPQSGGSSLDGLADGRLMNRLQYRNFGGYETLVANQTVKNAGVNAPRWYELRATGPSASWSVPQSGTYAPDALNRWMGSVAMNGAGEMALGYSAGDASTAAALRYTGRVAGDAAGTMPQGEGTLVAGGGVQTGTDRWGDYSQLTVDPLDDCTFWYTGEYYAADGATSWTTRIGSFKVSSCTAPALAYTAVPTITGTATEGVTLSATSGTWSPAATTTAYQWKSCPSTGVSCADIGGATASTYVLQPSDAGRRVRAKVTVTAGAAGPSSVVSASTATVHALPPVNSALPSVSGTMQMGQTAAAVNGTWSSYASVATTFTYQWQRCTASCNDIVGANQSTYAIADPGDVGAKLRVLVTATNNGGATVATSPQSATVLQAPAPSNLVAPSLTGSRMEGQTLTVQNGTWTGVSPISYSYQWQSCTSAGTSCTPTGWTSVTHILTSSDVGMYLRVVVTASNAGGATSVNTPLTTVILPKPPVLAPGGSPVLSGSATIGSALLTTDGNWTSTGAYTIGYQWQSCTSSTTCSNITGATSYRYDVTSAVAGTTIRAVVTATNAGGSTSATTGASVSVPAPAAGSGGSGGSTSGGGGGGGSGAPDLVVTGFPSSASPVTGGTVTFVVTVTDKNAMPAENLLVNVTLSGGLQYLTSTSDRGSGCVVTSATTLRCSLDWLSSDAKVGNLQITTKVIAGGAQTLTATASANQGDSDSSNNTLTVSVNTPTSATGTTATGGTTVPLGLNGDGTPTKKQDKKRPTARALLSAAKRGSAAKLRFKIYDDQGVAKAIATVKRGSKVVARTTTGYGPVAFGSVYYVGWHVPAKAAKGAYSFCVVAVDRAGNKSAQSCAALPLK